MPGGWPSHDHLANPLFIGDASISDGYNLPTGATADTYGSWVTLNSSTPNDITHLLLTPSNKAASGNSLSFDIAAAPAGNESQGIIIQQIILAQTYGPMNSKILLPVGPIPAGSRIAARCASTAASDTANLSAVAFDCGFGGGAPAIWDTYGWSGSGAIQGFQVDPGATADTKGAYTQITASVTNDLRGFFLAFDILNNPPTTQYDVMSMLVDVALGPSGSEVPIVTSMQIGKRNQNFYGNAYCWIDPTLTPVIPMPIAAGTRIAIRAQSTETTTPDRLFGVSLYGLRA